MSGNRSIRHRISKLAGLEILKNVILVVHFIGIAALLGGVIMQSLAMREARARIVAPLMHGAWTMLITGALLVGLRHPIGNEVNDTKITVKLLALVAIESWGQKIEDLGIEDLGIEEAHRRAPLVQGMIGAGMELIAHGVDEHTAAADVYRILVDGLKA